MLLRVHGVGVLCQIVLVAVLPASVAQHSTEQAVRARIRGFAGTVSLYAKNLDTGVAFGIRESEPVRTASTIKLPIMLAVFDAVARGEAKWTDPLTVTTDGGRLPLRDVVHLMIEVSDNTAANMLLDRFTAEAVNACLDQLGLHTTRALRKAGQIPENEKYGIGVSTPRDMVTILEKLERGEIVSKAASREMIGILKRCQDASGIRRRMGGLTVANETGVLDALRSDAGIVYSKGGRIAMAITVDGMPRVDYTPDNAGSLLIADLAKILVDGLGQGATELQ